jgi:hypothetical protein
MTGRDRYEGRRLDVAALLTAPDDPQLWVVDWFAARGAVTVLAGMAGIGKSAFAVGVASAAHGGRAEFAGFPVEHTPAIIIDAEQGKRVIARRLRAMEHVPDDLRYLRAGGLDVRRADDRQYLIAEIRAGDCGLVVADSLKRMSPGAVENSNDDMTGVLEGWAEIAQATDAAVIVIHHRSSERDFRGAQAIEDVPDALFVIEQCDDDPLKETRRRIRCAKMRLEREPRTRWVELPKGLGKLVIRAAVAHDWLAAEVTATDALAGELYAALIEHGGEVSRADLLRGCGRDSKDKAGRSAVDALVADGKAVKRIGLRDQVFVQATDSTYTEGVARQTPLDTIQKGAQGGDPLRGSLPPATPPADQGVRAATPSPSPNNTSDDEQRKIDQVIGQYAIEFGTAGDNR